MRDEGPTWEDLQHDALAAPRTPLYPTSLPTSAHARQAEFGGREGLARRSLVWKQPGISGVRKGGLPIQAINLRGEGDATPASSVNSLFASQKAEGFPAQLVSIDRQHR